LVSNSSLKELPFLNLDSLFHNKKSGSLVFLIFALLTEIEVDFFGGDFLEREIGDLLLPLAISPSFQA